MNRELFKEEILKVFNCDDSIFEKIEQYKKLLIDNNKNSNLTRLDSEEKIYLNYFFESIIIYKDILKNKKGKLLDIGSGSGIPGILINLFFPEIEVSIIESNNKKCAFMNLVVNNLNLKKVNIICKRAEKIEINDRESFDFVTSRAVAELKILLEISAPYLNVDGLIIEPKSLNLNLELENAKNIIKELDLEKVSIISDVFFNRSHNIIILKKNKKTSLNFPREWKEIIK